MNTDMQPTTGTAPPPSELNALLNRFLDEAEGMAEASSSTAIPAASRSQLSPPSGGSGSDGLPDPALLAALPILAENIVPLLGGLSRGVGSAPTATRPHMVDRHTALLCAVKPYLSPRRREAAETVIRLCRIWDALERSGISLPGLLSGLDRIFPTGSSSVSKPVEGDGKEVT